MHFSAITFEIARALSLEPEREPLDSLFDVVRPELTEWSVNEDGDPRGKLRVALAPADRERAREAVVRLPHPFVRALFDEIASGIVETYLGVALSPGNPSLRFWAAPHVSHRRSFVQAALRAERGLAEPMQTLSDLCGGIETFRGLGVEDQGERISRWTAYFSIPERPVAERLIQHIGLGGSVRRDFFLKALLGVDARRPRPFPKAWIGRGVGASSGWKLYYFARGDPHRLNDQVLLDLMDAGPALRRVWHILGNHAQPEVRRSGLLHLIGLTLPDAPRDAEPRLTVYFALAESSLRRDALSAGGG